MFGRARPYATVLGLLLLVAGPVWPARGAHADTAGAGAGSRSSATQSGWWNRLQGPAEGEPDGNPVRPLVPAVPKPPTVPADAIATSAGAGQVDKVAAVALDLVLADGAAVDGLVLRLVESKAEGANVGSDKAKVTACPATVPWGPSQNAAWRERPAADCKLGSVDGVRAADGTWTFDLTAIARLWTGAAPAPVPRSISGSMFPGRPPCSFPSPPASPSSSDSSSGPSVAPPRSSGARAAFPGPSPAGIPPPDPDPPVHQGALHEPCCSDEGRRPSGADHAGSPPRRRLRPEVHPEGQLGRPGGSRPGRVGRSGVGEPGGGGDRRGRTGDRRRRLPGVRRDGRFDQRDVIL